MIDSNDIIASFELVLQKSEDLKRHILYDLKGFPLWINNLAKDDFNDNVNQFLLAIFDINSTPGLMPQQTSAYQGALGGTSRTEVYVNELNGFKDEFRLKVKRFLQESQMVDTTLIHEVLCKEGHVDIKLKQVFRHVPFLSYHPRQISFCKVRHNSKRKITKEEASEKLKKIGRDENIQLQLNKLIKCDVNHLIVHRETPAQWAANIATFKDGNNHSSTTKLMTSLPVIYLQQNDLPLPIVKYAEKRQQRQLRQDRKIEKVAFLSSIHTYKYLNQ